MSASYLILAHSNPEHLRRLIARLSRQDGRVYLHIDRKSDVSRFRDLGPAVMLSDRRTVHWGDFSIVDATLALLRAALRDGGDTSDYFVLLSGADYPILPPARIDALFADRRGPVYMNMLPMPHPSKPMSRVEHYHLRGHWPRPLRKALQAIRVRLNLHRRDLSVLTDGARLYVGSQWWAVPRDVALHIVEFCDARPDVLRFLRNAQVPDEFLFQYIVGNSPFSGRVAGSLTYTEWAKGGLHPKVLDDADLDALLSDEPIRGSGMYPRAEGTPHAFARKFTDGSADLVARIDAFCAARQGN